MYFLVSWTLLFSQTAIPLQCSCETTKILGIRKKGYN